MSKNLRHQPTAFSGVDESSDDETPLSKPSPLPSSSTHKPPSPKNGNSSKEPVSSGAKSRIKKESTPDQGSSSDDNHNVVADIEDLDNEQLYEMFKHVPFDSYLGWSPALDSMSVSEQTEHFKNVLRKTLRTIKEVQSEYSEDIEGSKNKTKPAT